MKYKLENIYVKTDKGYEAVYWSDELLIDPYRKFKAEMKRQCKEKWENPLNRFTAVNFIEDEVREEQMNKIIKELEK